MDGRMLISGRCVVRMVNDLFYFIVLVPFLHPLHVHGIFHSLPQGPLSFVKYSPCI